jgi:hypothetical protein
LSQNVGPQQERQKKSAFYKNLAISLPNLDILDNVLGRTLKKIAFNSSKGLTRVIRDRHFIDIIAADIDLAYSPARPKDVKQKANESLETTIQQYVM